MKWGRYRSKGLSPVIATIILSAVVISIGGAIWSFAQGASTVIANNYVNETLTLMNEIIERFAVEHVSNNSEGSTLYVWIYNYGDVDIVVDVYANATHYNSTKEEYEYLYNANFTNSVTSEELNMTMISFSSRHLSAGDSVAIKVHSWRQNNAYYTYIAR